MPTEASKLRHAIQHGKGKVLRRHPDYRCLSGSRRLVSDPVRIMYLSSYWLPPIKARQSHCCKVAVTTDVSNAGRIARRAAQQENLPYTFL
jgi:hypothetical protein